MIPISLVALCFKSPMILLGLHWPPPYLVVLQFYFMLSLYFDSTVNFRRWRPPLLRKELIFNSSIPQDITLISPLYLKFPDIQSLSYCLLFCISDTSCLEQSIELYRPALRPYYWPHSTRSQQFAKYRVILIAHNANIFIFFSWLIFCLSYEKPTELDSDI